MKDQIAEMKITGKKKKHIKSEEQPKYMFDLIKPDEYGNNDNGLYFSINNVPANDTVS